MTMYLTHHLKSATHEIPIAESALTPDAFSTVTRKQGDTIEHLTLRWRLPAHQPEGKHAGHQFVLNFPVETLERLAEAIEVARTRFAIAEVPGRTAEAAIVLPTIDAE